MLEDLISAVKRNNILTYRQQQISPDIQWHAPGSRSCCSVGGVAIQAVEEPWHG
jgi:hypothetical protein